jgi:predicted amidohydrolase
MEIVWEDAPANFDRVSSLLDNARPRPHSLIVLPELFGVGFSMNTTRVAEPARGPTLDFLQRLAQRWKCAVIAGVPVRRGRRVFNEAVCLDARGRLTGRYAKTHLFSPAGEDRHYAAGSNLSVFQWKGVMVAPFVCYDLRFPEAFRAASQRGAELMVVIANWPAKRDEHWVALLKARAIENQAFVLGVNRTGSDPHLEYCGNSSLFGPKGELVATAGQREGILEAEVDVRICREWRKDFPVLQDRRKSLRVRTGSACRM